MPETVDVSQKGDVIRLALEADGSQLVSDHEAKLEAIESQRTSGLAPRVSTVDGESVETQLTQDQIDSVNATHDTMVKAADREYKVRILHLCEQKIRKAKESASFNDADIEAERAERKSKVDADINMRSELKPAFDADAIAIKSR